MVLEDHVGDGPGEVDANNDVMAGLRVAFDDRELSFGDSPGPAEDLTGHGQLADVVDRCRDPDTGG